MRFTYNKQKVIQFNEKISRLYITLEKDYYPRERERPRKQWERDIRDAFDRSITEAGQWALDRSGFCCAVIDATSIRISS